MPEVKAKPKLVNRGAAGLLGKVSKGDKEAPKIEVKGKKNNIAKGLSHLVVPIAKLKNDPENARLHPERNMEAIKLSLSQYGQVSPVVVRKQNNVVMAGNGRLKAAIDLGWDKIAAVFIEMTDAEAAGYGMADNRTAELAKWDFEMVAKHDQLLQKAGFVNIGWSQDELDVLRAADWTPPEVDDGDSFGGDGEGGHALLLKMTEDEEKVILDAIEDNKLFVKNLELSNEQALCNICTHWMETKPS